MSSRTTLMLAAALGFLAVAIGAFGAHGLAGRVEAGKMDAGLLDTFEVGVRYHAYHALALLALAGFVEGLGTAGKVAVVAFVFGVVIFAGSLYTLTLTGQRWLGAVTPIGGVSFMVGWVALFVGAWRSKRAD